MSERDRRMKKTTVDLGDLRDHLERAQREEGYRTLAEVVRLFLRESLERRGYLKGGAG